MKSCDSRTGIAFTATQQEAIDVSRRHLDACIVAGPGSGKTTVLVEHFRALVELGVDPVRILAITFTEKAAGNMRLKLGETFSAKPDIRARLERAWVSTVHGFCARLLRENAIFAGVDPDFYVAGEQESRRMQREAMAAAVEELFREDETAVRALIRGLSSFEFEDAVLAAYDAMRGAGVRLEDLPGFPAPRGVTIDDVAATLQELRREPVFSWTAAQREYRNEIIDQGQRIVTANSPLQALRAIEEFSANLNNCKRGSAAYELIRRLRDEIGQLKYSLITGFYAPQREVLLHVLGGFDRVYRAQKREAGALDFADLEEYAVRLLEEHGETRARLQHQFDHILMDEFQDTNGQQAKLLELARLPGRFYAVGDINQSIFGFRHAEPDGFRKYRDAVQKNGSRLVNLIDNFRSRPHILSAVETVVAGAPGIEPRPLVASRRFDTERAECVELCVAPDEAAEARQVARRIVELAGDGATFQFRDVAVLVRNTEVLSFFTEAFDEAAIPYVVNRGRGFYESREVKDLTHLLRAIANPRDEISMAAVLRSPLVAASDEALLRLKDGDGRNLGAALMKLDGESAAAFDREDWRKLQRFRERLRQWRVRREYVSFDRLLLEAIDDCDYRCSTAARGPGNVEKFLVMAREAAARQSLDAFLEELATARKLDAREAEAPPEDAVNAVQLMTVHAAKGLEFPVVFVAAIHKGIDAGQPPVAFSPRYGLGARWQNPARREAKNDVFAHAIHNERAVREKEEAHRLLYVAMTRAEQHLGMSFSGKAKEWAKVVATSLALDVETCRDETRVYRAPDGREWTLRLRVIGAAPDLLRFQGAAAESEDAELLDAPGVSDQHDTNVTVTGLAVFANCPRRYYLGQYLGFEGRLRGDAGSDSRKLGADELGTQVHALLAGAAVRDAAPEAERLAAVFRQSALGRRAARAGRVEREFDFMMAVDGVVLRGQVDLWFEEGGELTIVDYKTDSVSAAEAQLRAAEYSLQLQLYAMAVERVAGRPPDNAWLYFLRPNTAVSVDLRPSLWDSPEQAVQYLTECQGRMDFPLRESEHCRRCEFYKRLCPSSY